MTPLQQLVEAASSLAVYSEPSDPRGSRSIGGGEAPILIEVRDQDGIKSDLAI